MIYVTPGQRLSCTTGSAATPRTKKLSPHRGNSLTSPQNSIRVVMESISLPRQRSTPHHEIRVGLGGKGALTLLGVISPPPSPHPRLSQKNAASDVSSARQGRKGAVENTPSEAHRRIWQSRGCRESRNVEGISLRTGKWRGAGETPAEGRPRVQASAGGEAAPGQGRGIAPPRLGR